MTYRIDDGHGAVVSTSEHVGIHRRDKLALEDRLTLLRTAIRALDDLVDGIALDNGRMTATVRASARGARECLTAACDIVHTQIGRRS